MRSALATAAGSVADYPAGLSSGMERVEMMLKRETGDTTTYWNGGGWVTNKTWMVTSTPTATTWEFPGGGQTMPSWQHNVTYNFAVRAKDEATNEETVFAVGTDSNTVTFDLMSATAACSRIIGSLSLSWTFSASTLTWIKPISPSAQMHARRSGEV